MGFKFNKIYIIHQVIFPLDNYLLDMKRTWDPVDDDDEGKKTKEEKDNIVEGVLGSSSFPRELLGEIVKTISNPTGPRPEFSKYTDSEEVVFGRNRRPFQGILKTSERLRNLFLPFLFQRERITVYELSKLKNTIELYHMVNHVVGISGLNQFNMVVGGVVKRVFPRDLKSIKFSKGFDQSLESVPDTVRTLELGRGFNQRVDVEGGYLPNKLMTLKVDHKPSRFYDEFSHPISGVLPKTLQELSIYSPSEITDFPPELKVLDLYSSQDQSVDHFPPSLETLKIGGRVTGMSSDKFPNLQTLSIWGDELRRGTDISLNGGLPKSLKKFKMSSKIGREFDYDISILPESLTYLSFCPAVDFDINRLGDQVPQLKTLILEEKHTGYHHSPKIIRVNKLPEKLEHLVWGGNYQGYMTENTIPKTLKSITYGTYYDGSYDYTSATSVTKLTFQGDFNQSLDDDISLPPNLRELTLGYGFDKPFSMAPESLKELTFGYNFNSEISPEVLRNLETLTFGDNYNKEELFQSECPNLRKLTFGSKYNQTIDFSKLPNLEELTFGEEYNRALDGPLPDSLRYIRFGDMFNKELPEELPEGLEILILGGHFDEDLDLSHTKLRELHFASNLHNHGAQPGISFSRELDKLPDTLQVLTFSGPTYKTFLENSNKMNTLPVGMIPMEDYGSFPVLEDSFGEPSPVYHKRYARIDSRFSNHDDDQRNTKPRPGTGLMHFLATDHDVLECHQGCVNISHSLQVMGSSAGTQLKRGEKVRLVKGEQYAIRNTCTCLPKCPSVLILTNSHHQHEDVTFTLA